MEKCGRVGHVTDDDIISRMLIACWIIMAIDTLEIFYVFAPCFVIKWHYRNQQNAPLLNFVKPVKIAVVV